MSPLKIAIGYWELHCPVGSLLPKRVSTYVVYTVYSSPSPTYVEERRGSLAPSAALRAGPPSHKRTVKATQNAKEASTHAEQDATVRARTSLCASP